MTATAEATSTLALTVNRSAILDCVSAVKLVARSRFKPVLECVRMTTDGGTLHLDCTDLATSLRRSTSQVQIDGHGVCCVSANDLHQWLSVIDDDTVDMAVEGDWLRLKSGAGMRKIYTVDANDFPPIPTALDKPTMTVTLPLDAMRAAHEFVGHAVPQKADRYAVNGVLIQPGKKQVTLVATDGRRLAVLGVEAAVEGKQSAIVPRDFFSFALRAMPEDSEAEMSISISDNSVLFQSGDAIATSVLIEGSFPPWDDVIPKDSDILVAVDRESFRDALRRAQCTQTDESKGCRFKITKGGVAISSQNAKRGEAEVNYPCKVEGRDLEIGGNPDFFIAALEGMVGDEVKIECTSANRPFKLTCGPMTEVIMPVNLQ